MPSYKVSVKWGKNNYKDIDLSTDEPPEVFKAQLYALSGVPPDRQKLMIKGKTIPDHSWDGITVSEGASLMMMGSAESLPVAPPTATKAAGRSGNGEEEFELEDPLGLVNLGNTCYLNATLQCFRAVPELRKALKKFHGGLAGFTTEQQKAETMTAAMQALFNDMEKQPDKMVPFILVNSLRQAYPRFAERGERGEYVQQDANECWTELMTCLRQQLPSVEPVDSRWTPLAAQRSETASTINMPTSGSNIRNAVEQYMYGEMSGTMKCVESADEPEIKTKESFLQLSCFINPELKYLQAGLANRMKDQITKRAETLGRDAVFEKTMRLERLPAYLTIQLVRFHFKQQVSVGAKILKDVKFPLLLDVFDLCSDELKQKLTPNRLKFKEFEEAEIDRAVKSGKKLQKMSDEEQRKLQYAPYWFADDVGSNNSGYYELEAVLTHQGRTSNSGHYVAWVRRTEDVWVKYDDDTVSLVNSEEILKLSGGGDWHCAYLLLYGPRRLPILPETKSETAASTPALQQDIPMD